eukprot:scaffold92686_cov36-Phaeocystis_antarctica.AAC.3
MGPAVRRPPQYDAPRYDGRGHGRGRRGDRILGPWQSSQTYRTRTSMTKEGVHSVVANWARGIDHL